MLISHGECRKCGPSQAPLQGDLVKALHLSETCRSALRLGSCPSCALTTYKWLIVVSLDRSVPRKEASLMSLSTMTLMTTSLYPRRRRKGRAVAVNRKAKRRKVERGRRRGGEDLQREKKDLMMMKQKMAPNQRSAVHREQRKRRLPSQNACLLQ